MRSLLWLNTISLGILTLAHNPNNDFHTPQIFGGRQALQHLPRHIVEDIQSHGPHLHRRAKPPGTEMSQPDIATGAKCGPVDGFCQHGDCCSHVGFCGRGPGYCASPNCQMAYSNGCDGSKKPLGEPLLDLPRPLIGNVSYDSVGIDHCQNAGQLAITFDDGPYNDTSHLLDVFASFGVKATFFITGNNLGKGQIDVEENGWPAILRRMHAEGHQIASHTWSHQNLSALNESEIVNQIHYNEMAFRNVLGFVPTYIRPPFTECRNACPAVLKRMGYHIIYQNAINFDWLNDASDTIQQSKMKFEQEMSQTTPASMNYIFLQHDTRYQTCWNLTNYMLDYFRYFNYSKSVTVGECLNDPPQNWYRPAGGAPDPKLLRYRSHSSTLHYSALLLIVGQFFAYTYL